MNMFNRCPTLLLASHVSNLFNLHKIVWQRISFDFFKKFGKPVRKFLPIIKLKNLHLIRGEEIATLNIICCQPFLADIVMTEVVGCTADVRFNCDWYFPIRAAWNCFPYSSPSYSCSCKLIGLPMHWQILLQPILNKHWKKWYQDLSVLRPALLIDWGPIF